MAATEACRLSKKTGGKQSGRGAAKPGKKDDADMAEEGEGHKVRHLRDLSQHQRQQIVDNALATNEQSNDVLLEKYAERAERYGVESTFVQRKSTCIQGTGN